MKITERGQKILESLAFFKYLTASQMLFLGIGKHDSNLRPTLKDLKAEKLIDFITFGIVPKIGQLERFHFLTQSGANLIDENPNIFNACGCAKYPKNTNSLFHNDYFHRKSTIDFNICFYLWAKENDLEIDFFDYYFDTNGANRKNGTDRQPLESKNKLIFPDGQFVIPDIIGQIRGINRNYLFIAEIHMGNDTKRLFKQIFWHSHLASEGIAGKKYNYPHNIRVFVVLENANMVQLITERMRQAAELAPFAPFFWFKSLEEMKSDFGKNWQNMNGEFSGFVV